MKTDANPMTSMRAESPHNTIICVVLFGIAGEVATTHVVDRKTTMIWLQSLLSMHGLEHFPSRQHHTTDRLPLI
eukprot:scaffold461399_cov18-Prasinocladus_malaysianus.AAC.1